MVVCLENPALARNGRRPKQLQERCGVVCWLWKGIRVECLTHRDVLRFSRIQGVRRTAICEQLRRDIGFDTPMVVDDDISGIGHGSDDGGAKAPLVTDRDNFIFVALFDHAEHALLGLTGEDFSGGHAGFALRDDIGINVHANIALARHFDACTGKAGSAEVLDAADVPGSKNLKRRFDQQLAKEGVANLDIGALRFGCFGDLHGCKRCAMNTIPACG